MNWLDFDVFVEIENDASKSGDGDGDWNALNCWSVVARFWATKDYMGVILILRKFTIKRE